MRVGVSHVGFRTIIYKNGNQIHTLYESPLNISFIMLNRNTLSVNISTVYHGSRDSSHKGWVVENDFSIKPADVHLCIKFKKKIIE